jgi:hypothetical protein
MVASDVIDQTIEDYLNLGVFSDMLMFVMAAMLSQ